MSTPRPRLIACWFEGDPCWTRLARVFESTARRHCAGWDVRITKLEPRDASRARLRSGLFNTQKLDHWAAAVEAAEDGTQLLLIDADTVILRSLDDVWTLPFDLALTARNTARMPYPWNAGVVFLRSSPVSRAFMARWRTENARMLADRQYHDRWRARYAGLNQAALGAVLEDVASAAPRLEMASLPCAEWNCEDSTWGEFSDRTCILHVKSALRGAILGFQPATPKTAPLVRLWERLESAA